MEVALFYIDHSSHFFTTHEDHGLLSNCLRTEVPSTTAADRVSPFQQSPATDAHGFPLVVSLVIVNHSTAEGKTSTLEVDGSTAWQMLTEHVEMFLGGCIWNYLDALCKFCHLQNRRSPQERPAKTILPLPHVVPWSDILWYRSFFKTYDLSRKQLRQGNAVTFPWTYPSTCRGGVGGWWFSTSAGWVKLASLGWWPPHRSKRETPKMSRSISTARCFIVS